MFGDKKEISKSSQSISIKGVEGGAIAENMHIGKVENLTVNKFFGPISECLESKKYEEKDIFEWENEELIFSVSDTHMIKGLIENEKEVKEILPKLAITKKVFLL